DPATVYSSIDEAGRYAYGNQPVVAQWNLARFAESLLPLLHQDEEQAVEVAKETLEAFPAQYSNAWSAGMRTKLGLPADRNDDAVSTLVHDLLALLHQDRVDYTSFFRTLAGAARGDAEPVRGVFVQLADCDAWLHSWQALSPDADVM